MVDSPTVLIENYYMRLNELGADGLVHALRTYTLPAEFSEFVRSCDSVVFTNPCHQDARYFVILCEAARLMTLHEAIPEGLYVEVSEACGRVSFNRSDEEYAGFLVRAMGMCGEMLTAQIERFEQSDEPITRTRVAAHESTLAFFKHVVLTLSRHVKNPESWNTAVEGWWIERIMCIGKTLQDKTLVASVRRNLARNRNSYARMHEQSTHQL